MKAKPPTPIREILRDLQDHDETESGQGLAEYALILVLIAVVCVAAVGALGSAISAGLGSAAGMF